MNKINDEIRMLVEVLGQAVSQHDFKTELSGQQAVSVQLTAVLQCALILAHHQGVHVETVCSSVRHWYEKENRDCSILLH